MISVENYLSLRREIRERGPLIHCLTNHITINDCANMVLALGGKPIMAEHPSEVEEITRSAAALAMNLGNITDERMESMRISTRAAWEEKIPSILDLVGVACSRLRLEFAKKLIKTGPVTVIKGNSSEIRAFCGASSQSKGIDAGEGDSIDESNLEETKVLAMRLSQATGSAVVITGAEDLITDGSRVYLLNNGCPELARVTGTGCMLNVMIGTYLPGGDVLGACVLGTALMGISGEQAREQSGGRGIGSFRTALFDGADTMTDETLMKRIKIREL